MAEKKILTIGVRMDEPMHLQLKRLAEEEGMTESEFIRIAVSNLIEEKKAVYLRLHSIFGHGAESIKSQQVQQRETSDCLSDMPDEIVG